MKLIKYFIILIIFSFLNCNKNVDSQKDLEHFNFTIDTGYEDSYNSENSRFERKFEDSTYVERLDLNLDDKTKIYNMYKKLDIKSMPKQFSIQGEVVTMHSSKSSIKICTSPNSCQKIQLDFEDIKYNNIKQLDQAIKFKYFFEFVWNVISSKEIYRQIPESDVLYF